MPPLTRVPMSEQRWTGYMSLQITPPFMGHVSFGEFNEGCFHRGHCQVACHFGVRFQAVCLLGYLGFWSPINRRLQAFQVTFFWIFLALELFLSLQSSAFLLPQLRSPLTLSYGLIVLPNPALGEPCFYKLMPFLDSGKPTLLFYWFIFSHCSFVCCLGLFSEFVIF